MPDSWSCVLPIAGGSGIHRPVAKKAMPGAEYKAKVSAACKAWGLLALDGCQGGARRSCAHHCLERHLAGTQLRPGKKKGYTKALWHLKWRTLLNGLPRIQELFGTT